MPQRARNTGTIGKDGTRQKVDAVERGEMGLMPDRPSKIKWDAENTERIGLKLNKRTDADIIAWLNAQPSKQGAIKDAIRSMLQAESGHK